MKKAITVLALLGALVTIGAWADVYPPAGGIGSALLVLIAGSTTTPATLAFDANFTGATSSGTTTVSPDTTKLATRDQVQAQTDISCASGSGSGTTFTCTHSKALAAYADGMTIAWKPDVTCTGTPTLNIDSLGAKSLVESDGTTAASCTAGLWLLLTYNGTSAGTFRKQAGGGSSVAAAAPYLQIGSNYYLPFGFQAAVPPTSGWTGANFTGSTFTTSGLGGALSLQSQSFAITNGSLAGQYRSAGATTTLTFALSAQQYLTSSYSGCSAGAYNSTSGAAYVIGRMFYSSTDLTVEQGFGGGISSADMFGNDGEKGTGSDQLFFGRIQITGSNIISSVSSNGLQWTVVKSRSLGGYGIASSYDSWVFSGGGSSSNPVTCTLLSWSAQ